jgi:hypothetical protein
MMQMLVPVMLTRGFINAFPSYTPLRWSQFISWLDSTCESSGKTLFLLGPEGWLIGCLLMGWIMMKIYSHIPVARTVFCFCDCLQVRNSTSWNYHSLPMRVHWLVIIFILLRSTCNENGKQPHVVNASVHVGGGRCCCLDMPWCPACLSSFWKLHVHDLV